MGIRNSFFGDAKIVGVFRFLWQFFNSNKAATSLLASDADAPDAHCVVENRVAGVGIGSDQVFTQGDRLLCRVQNLRGWHLVKVQHQTRELLTAFI